MWGKLAQWLLQPIIIKLVEKLAYVIPKAILDYIEKNKKEKAVQEAKQKLEETINKPDSTKEQVADAYKDFINSGNKP